MRSLALAACLLGAGFHARAQDAAHPSLADVQRVYLLPMAQGLDQFLANQLTGERVLEVVTDPKLADAVITDAIGEGFEQALDLLLPPAQAPVEADDKSRNDDLLRGETSPLLRSGFRRGKGNVFLVAIGSRSVLWSTFRQPKDTTAKQLDRTADRIVKDLREAIEGK